MKTPDLNKDHTSFCKPPPSRTGRRACLVPLALDRLFPTHTCRLRHLSCLGSGYRESILEVEVRERGFFARLC